MSELNNMAIIRPQEVSSWAAERGADSVSVFAVDGIGPAVTLDGLQLTIDGESRLKGSQILAEARSGVP
ncbi:hypothetical protein XELAEV_18034992mg [Xenopus laevis]|uniref:Uncharacterized protein n=1 Tax=Xenopus laevis TaxID=8355 RepID=A0A974CEW3_XENLA|nr:hypothetical protein XELAEV_18034992mg [Xenopus laevis]